MENKKTIYAVVVILVVILIVYVLSFLSKGATVANILSFEDCANAGYPVMESYPRQCRTPDGRNFAEEIPKPTDKVTYISASADLIVVESPFPGAVTGKEFSVVG